MRPPIVLCADSFSLRFPEVLGLPEENLRAQGWLQAFSDAEEVREYVACHPATPEVWVVGSDDVEAINLAAGIKALAGALEGAGDAGHCAVYLVTGEGGDVPNRAQAANLDGILSPARFVCRYAEEKMLWAKACNVSVSLICGDGRTRRCIGMPAASAGGVAQMPAPQPMKMTIIGEKPASELSPQAVKAMSVVCAEEKPAEAPMMPAEVVVAEEPATPLSAAAVATGQAMLLPVVSATGGVGRSTVAALCALSAARLGKKTLLVDADFQFGTCLEMVDGDHHSALAGAGVTTAASFDEVLAGTVTPELLAAKTPVGGLAVLGALRVPEQAEACIEAFPQWLEAACRHFEVVVVDTPSWWSEVQASLIDRAGKVLYVLDQRPAAVRGAAKALDLCSRCGMATGAFEFLLNRCKRGSLYGAEDMEQALKGFPVGELPEGGQEVAELVAAGCADDLFVACNPLAMELHDRIRRLLGISEQTVRQDARGRRRGTGIMRWPLRRERRDEPCPF